MTSSKNCSLLLKIIHEPAFAFFLFLTAIAKVMAAFAGANSSIWSFLLDIVKNEVGPASFHSENCISRSHASPTFGSFSHSFSSDCALRTHRFMRRCVHTTTHWTHRTSHRHTHQTHRSRSIQCAYSYNRKCSDA